MSLKATLAVAALILAPFAAFAQTDTNRSYHYKSIVTTANVNVDTTVNFEETQTYQFVGEYHQGWRSIPRNKIDAITDVSVVDEWGVPLEYSRKRLDKTKPSSWGKYTVFTEDGATNIEWYYDAKDTQKTWTLQYTVHGAIAFYDTHDELYWNLFTDYDVPVDVAEAFITVPGTVSTTSAAFYSTNDHEYVFEMPKDNAFHFFTADIAPGEDITFAVGWQKGLVDEAAYWRDALKIYWQLLAAAVVFLSTIMFSIVYRTVQRRKYRGRGTIIPQYEPPLHLRPAMAEVIAKSHISQRAWPATIIDLAVRGYLKIEEKATDGIFGWFKGKDYRVTRVKRTDEGLEEYEKDFLAALFAEGETFSTAELSKSPTMQQKISAAVTKVTKKLYEETQTDTRAFQIPPTGNAGKLKEAKFLWIFVGLLILSLSTAQFIFAVSIVIAAVVLMYVVVFMPLLNTAGSILKEEWLGFKMFLEVTGKDRMQNLTPDMFEKFLPYAMIFGVEKQWAKKFEAINVPPPEWYSNNGAAFVAASSGNAGGFSPTSFATGFSASFSSSFASSGGGGASGGGGGAGGGGGGGGGGAS